jgi:hypothetical protein
MSGRAFGRGLFWGAAKWRGMLRLLTELEAGWFNQRKIAGSSMLGWNGQLLEARVTLIGETRAALATAGDEEDGAGT